MAGRRPDPESLARDNEAIKMRARHKTWREIVETLGYASEGAAHRQVQRRLKERRAALDASADELMAQMVGELDEMAREAWGVLEREHVQVSNGSVVRDDMTGERILDDGPVLQAIDRLARVLGQKAKLLGLEKPAPTEGGLTITIKGVSEEEMP